MGMPGEAGEVVVRIVVAEIVQEQEGIEVAGVAEAEGPPEADSGAFDGGFGLAETLDGTDGHGSLLVPLQGITAVLVSP